jgi:hypothetical protein
VAIVRVLWIMKLYQPKTSRATLVRALALAATVTLALSIAGSIAGCSDDHRRLSEKETLDYKRALIGRGELSASQATEFGSDTRRTTAEIDALYGRMSAESAEQRAKERAYWENELHRESAETAEP